jgi:predicted Zn-dependent protease
LTNRPSSVAKLIEIQELEIAAAAGAAKGNLDAAIEIMKTATGLAAEMPPPPGPPPVIKPAHELFGEVLLRAGRAAEAARQFETALFRHPGRARSILGLARATAAIGETERAVRIYSRFLHQWQEGNAESPEVTEAQKYLNASVRR